MLYIYITTITNNMVIKINITNFLTQVSLSTTIEHPEFAESVDSYHDRMRRSFPDCQVDFYYGNDFICSRPLNEELDEKAEARGEITWEQFVNKWYKGDLCGCNEE